MSLALSADCFGHRTGQVGALVDRARSPVKGPCLCAMRWLLSHLVNHTLWSTGQGCCRWEDEVNVVTMTRTLSMCGATSIDGRGVVTATSGWAVSGVVMTRCRSPLPYHWGDSGSPRFRDSPPPCPIDTGGGAHLPVWLRGHRRVWQT